MHLRHLAALGALILAVAACAETDTDPATAAGPSTGVDGSDASSDTATAEGELDDAPDLEDPNDQVVDGAFRGEGMIIPALADWSFDEFAYAQGVVLASSPNGEQQLAGQAVDNDDLPEDQRIDLDELIEANLAQFTQEPSVDEPVEVAGADRAHQLRFDDVEGTEEGQPASSVLIVLAATEDGRIGVFNYAAYAEAFDEDAAEELLTAVGFDPDSEPSAPSAQTAPGSQPAS